MHCTLLACEEGALCAGRQRPRKHRLPGACSCGQMSVQCVRHTQRPSCRVTHNTPAPGVPPKQLSQHARLCTQDVGITYAYTYPLPDMHARPSGGDVHAPPLRAACTHGCPWAYGVLGVKAGSHLVGRTAARRAMPLSQCLRATNTRRQHNHSCSSSGQHNASPIGASSCTGSGKHVTRDALGHCVQLVWGCAVVVCHAAATTASTPAQPGCRATQHRRAPAKRCGMASGSSTASASSCLARSSATMSSKVMPARQQPQASRHLALHLVAPQRWWHRITCHN